MSNIILEKSAVQDINRKKKLKKSKFLNIQSIDKKVELSNNEDKNINSNLYEDYARVKFKEILNISIYKNASDIHIEPFEEEVIVRLRVDGVLNQILTLDMDLYSSLSTVIKLDSGMNITEKRLPQDGRTDIKLDDYIIDIRVSTTPTIYGEKIVLRILNRQDFIKDKSELGFSDYAIEKINNIINKKSGILLVTGSTGSGKTTTVYSILNDLIKENKNIMTIEDPVEYKIKGINQIQVNPKVGLTFDLGLRSILRQDPDIIMVGEIRDVETAKTAIRAASTGHLVISTMHTNDAISSINRLIEMKLPPYLISSTLIGIISQKLVRKVCTACGDNIDMEDETKDEVCEGIEIVCEKCKNLRYSGRTAMYEILVIDDNLKEEIKDWKNSNKIKQVAIENGMITFEDSARYLIENNITILEECIY